MDYIQVYIKTYFIFQIMKAPKYFGHSGIVVRESVYKVTKSSHELTKSVHKVTKPTNARNVQHKSYNLLPSFSRLSTTNLKMEAKRSTIYSVIYTASYSRRL